jgi:signal transduction histidine kinase/ActR/RegA family two-component response regulator
MPGMDGFETAAMIHDHPRFERTPIIFITGVHDTEFDRLKGYKLGAVDYVSIPVVPEILRSKVSVLVELHCQRLELQKLNRSLANANEQLEQANTTLQAEKNRELEALNMHLQKANAELAASNEALQAEIGERARAEAALLEADRHKDEFLAILAHELRNPLAPIRNAVEILRRAGSDPVALASVRELMERQVAQMARLIDDLLDLSRISHNRLQLRRDTVALRDVVESAIETSRPLMDERRHELTVELPDTPVWLHADLTRLAQVLVNLLNNSAKYTEPGGRIRLSARCEQSEVLISVEDNGIGIPADMLPRVFDMFTQADRTLDHSRGGLGIGLTLVRRLVEMHAGKIEVRSVRGQGTTFIIRLPVLSAPARVQPPRAVEPHAPGTSRQRVLIVDDNEDSALSLATLLDLSGNETRVAHDGLQAIGAADSTRPDVVLLDIGLPRRSGYEVARHIRAQPWGKSALLIAITGWGQDDDRRRSEEAGFDAHLVKPIDPVALERLLLNRERPAA